MKRGIQTVKHEIRTAEYQWNHNTHVRVFINDEIEKMRPDSNDHEVAITFGYLERARAGVDAKIAELNNRLDALKDERREISMANSARNRYKARYGTLKGYVQTI